MVPTRHPFIGYQLKPSLTHLLPACDGRPTEYCLSALYLTDDFHLYDEARQKLFSFEEPIEKKRYPGAHPLF